MESRGSADGERKTITTLFADLKGSTALIEGLDPEDARAIIDPALQIMMDAVHRYDGYVAQALGDGIFALFGAPIAHEDHPQRALYAALRMQDEMRGYSDQLRLKGNAPLHMRAGINTGEVVVRSIRKDDLHTDYVPIGHSTNLAARMEQLANPGSIVVTEQTHKLTDGYFEFKDLGKTPIKGVEEPLNVYEVTGVGPLRTRLQVSARRGLTRFVGRHRELDQLYRALQQAKEGHGQIVGVMGEPGFQLQAEFGAIVCGLAKVGQGQPEEGFAQLRQGLAGYRSVGAEISLTFFLASLIGAYEQVGQPEDGLPVVAETLERVEKTGERYCEAELYRLKGELTLQESKVESQRSLAEEEAEACFRKAIEIAQKQQAKSWELRATTSLARLWREQGKREEARELLAPVYGWFTEGFDTADLRDAKALLTELSEGR